MGAFARISWGVAAAVALIHGGSAFAQATIGELVDTGGKQVRKDELVRLLSGTTYTGETRLGLSFRIRSSADGSFTGDEGPRRVTFSGKWWVESDGLQCWQMAGTRGREQTSCATWFRKGADYFVSDADGARGAPLRRRVFH